MNRVKKLVAQTEASAAATIKSMGYTLVPIKTVDDLSVASLGSTVSRICSGEVNNKYAASIVTGADKDRFFGYKLVQTGDKKAVALGMYLMVSPMRAYEAKHQPEIAAAFEANAKKTGFSQRQLNEAAELVVLCVASESRGQKLGLLLIQHAVEQAKKRFIVVAQEKGLEHDAATVLYNSIFDNTFEVPIPVDRQTTSNATFYVDTSDKVLAKLREKVAKVAGTVAPLPGRLPQKTVAAAEKQIARVAGSKRAARPSISGPSAPSKKRAPSSGTPIQAAAKRRKTTKTCYQTVLTRRSYANYVAKIFRSLAGKQKSISRKAVCAIDAFIREQLEAVALVARNIIEKDRRATMTHATLTSALRLCYPMKDLQKHCLANGALAVKKFNENAHKRRAARAGIFVAPSRVKQMLSEMRVARRYQAAVDVYLAGVANYLIAEILEITISVMDKARRLTPRHVMLAIRNDQELNQVASGTFGASGVVPSINAALLPQKKK